MKICRLCGEQKNLTDFQVRRAVCRECRKLQQTAWRKENQEYLNQKQREWEQQNPEVSKATKQRWKDANPDFELEYHRRWRQENRQYVRAQVSARRKKVKQQTPPWADLSKIIEIYKNCPEGYHVDHIIPLRGKFVSGLHVETNLQYLPASENMRKGNKFESYSTSGRRVCRKYPGSEI